MTAERPDDEGKGRSVNLPPLQQPFGRHEVAQWWGDVAKKMGPERPPSVLMHRPVVGLTALAVLLGASGALAIVWPRLAPPAAAPPVASVAAASSGHSPQKKTRPRGARPATSQAPGDAPDSADVATSEDAATSDGAATRADTPASAAPPAGCAAPAVSAAPASGAPASSQSAGGAPAAPASGGPANGGQASAAAASGGQASGAQASGAASGASDDAPGRRPWRELARSGAFGDAYSELTTAGGVARAAATASVDDLFALADVARLSGHPREAVAPLSQIVQRGGGQAALAAFTLGRLRLDQLGEPAAAAQDFERAVALGLGGALREDALVRRITALARSGQDARAREAAVSYAALFPASRRRVEAWLPKDD